MREHDRAIGVVAASELLGVSPRSLGDRRFRIRLGLQARRIGGRIVFLESDLLRLLERGRERLPGERR